jgi:hypothetical protein
VCKKMKVVKQLAATLKGVKAKVMVLAVLVSAASVVLSSCAKT